MEYTALARLPKAELARRVQNHPRFVWAINPPIKWTKEELIAELLELEAV